jgi:cation transport ATPase
MTPAATTFSMKRILRLALQFRMVTLTLLVGLAGGILWAFGYGLTTQAVFSVFALAVAGVRTWHMVNDLRHGKFGVDILAMIAILATVLVGEYVASIIIVLMITGGQALEDFAESRAQRELSSLLAREPQVVHRTDPATGEIVEVPARAVLPGDSILVRSGEVVPVDGTLLSVSGSFDESSLTGESMPAQRLQGDAILSGSINGLNAVTMTATATAADSSRASSLWFVRHSRIALPWFGSPIGTRFHSPSSRWPSEPARGSSPANPSGSLKCLCWQRRAPCSWRLRSRSWAA